MLITRELSLFKIINRDLDRKEDTPLPFQGTLGGSVYGVGDTPHKEVWICRPSVCDIGHLPYTTAD